MERVVGEVQLVGAHAVEEPPASDYWRTGRRCECVASHERDWSGVGVGVGWEQSGYRVQAERRMRRHREEPEEHVDRRLLHRVYEATSNIM